MSDKYASFALLVLDLFTGATRAFSCQWNCTRWLSWSASLPQLRGILFSTAAQFLPFLCASAAGGLTFPWARWIPYLAKPICLGGAFFLQVNALNQAMWVWYCERWCRVSGKNVLGKNGSGARDPSFFRWEIQSDSAVHTCPGWQCSAWSPPLCVSSWDSWG